MSWKQYCKEENWHPAANLFPMLCEEEAAELAEDISKHGLQNPIVLFDDKVLDGRNRLLACKVAEVEPQFKEWQANGSSPVSWVISQNLKRRHLTATQKAVVAFEALPLFEAEAKARQKISEGRGQKKESDGKGSQSSDYLNRGKASEQAAKSTGANRQYVSDVKRIADKAPELVEKMKSGELNVTEALVKAGFKEKLEKLTSSDSNEWYTPKEYIDAAKKVLDKIDLDPASCSEANKTVKAMKFYSIEDDGLEKIWKGRVWLNPPYGDVGPEFTAKLLKEFKAGNVTEAILLVNSHTGTKWCVPLLRDYRICFVTGRIKFISVEKSDTTGSTHDSIIVYLGENTKKFREVFEEFGPVLCRDREDK